MSAQEPTPVKELPYYNSLREALEPYIPAKDAANATDFFTTAEIIAAVEQHHGVPQGPQKGVAENWVQPGDFVRAMHHLGFREVNVGGLQLSWLCKKK